MQAVEPRLERRPRGIGTTSAGGLFPTPFYHLGGLFPTVLYHLHPCRRASMQAGLCRNDGGER